MSGSNFIIPTLDSQSILMDPRDILSYIIRYYCTAPKSVSNTAYNYTISLTDTISKYQGNRSQLKQYVTNDLQEVLNRFYPVNTSSIDISTEENDNNSYNVVIKISVIKDGRSYSIGADVSVSANGILQPKWHPNLG